MQQRTAIGFGLRGLCDFSSNLKWSFPSSLFVSVLKEIQSALYLQLLCNNFNKAEGERSQGQIDVV